MHSSSSSFILNAKKAQNLIEYSTSAIYRRLQNYSKNDMHCESVFEQLWKYMVQGL